jgi:hypothetical protein
MFQSCNSLSDKMAIRDRKQGWSYFSVQTVGKVVRRFLLTPTATRPVNENTHSYHLFCSTLRNEQFYSSLRSSMTCALATVPEAIQ